MVTIANSTSVEISVDKSTNSPLIRAASAALASPGPISAATSKFLDKLVVVAPDNKYVVYSDGTIHLPLLNTVKVSGLTMKELNQELTGKYKRYLKQPYVKSSVLNHKVFALGEVTNRGAIKMEGESISVIEVIARAGGLTDYAIRDRVRIISEENGEYVLRTLNLNKFSTLNSGSLMLKHNSIIYIEPKGTKAVRVAINDYVPIIQAISSVLSTFLTISILNDK